MSVFNKNSTSSNVKNQPLFLGEELSVARYDQKDHEVFYQLTSMQLSFYWRPHEVSLSNDRVDFHNKLNDAEKHIFTSNLQYQTVLDSVQGRAPNLCFLPLVTSNTLEGFINTWTAFENLHSDSYTHIIRSLYDSSSVVFDDIYTHQYIQDNAANVSMYYDELLEAIYYYKSVGPGLYTKHNNKQLHISLKDLKLKLFKAMVAVSALEALRFHVAFACHFALGETSKLEGCVKIMRFISRDEACHCSATHNILLNWLSPSKSHDPEMHHIATSNKDLIQDIYYQVAQQEKKWSAYVFSKGALPSFNEKIACSYIDYLTVKNLRMLQLTERKMSNPIPWISKYLSASDVMFAPQEVEVSSYMTGSIAGDLASDDLSDFDDI